VRRTVSGLSLTEATPRKLKKLARPTLQHSPFSATCDYVKKQLALIVRPCASDGVRVKFDGSYSRKLKKLRGRHCSIHRLGATCDYVKKQLVLIVTPYASDGSGLSLRKPLPRAKISWRGPTLQHAPFRRYMRLCQKAISAYCEALCVGRGPG